MNSIMPRNNIKAVLSFILIIGIVTTFINMVNNILLKKEFELVIISSALLVICLILFATRKKWHDNNTAVTAFAAIFSLIIFPLVWINSHGVSGSMPLYSLLLVVMLTYVLQGGWGRVIPVAFITICITLIASELYNPSFFGAYETRELLIANLLTSFSTSSILLFILIYIIRKHYESIQNKLYEFATTDDLTGVYNRRHLIERLKEIINQHTRNHLKFSILFIDINDFKIINDDLGHIAGDHVLELLAKAIKESVRNYDVIGRYGGDEFVIVMPGTDINEADAISQRVSERFLHLSKQMIGRSVTLAVGTIEGNNLTLEEILVAADYKMYQNKRQK